jgi:hypothetical protein
MFAAKLLSAAYGFPTTRAVRSLSRSFFREHRPSPRLASAEGSGRPPQSKFTGPARNW